MPISAAPGFTRSAYALGFLFASVTAVVASPSQDNTHVTDTDAAAAQTEQAGLSSLDHAPGQLTPKQRALNLIKNFNPDRAVDLIRRVVESDPSLKNIELAMDVADELDRSDYAHEAKALRDAAGESLANAYTTDRPDTLGPLPSGVTPPPRTWEIG